jgi:DHA1 family inner membrane transport protein
MGVGERGTPGQAERSAGQNDLPQSRQEKPTLSMTLFLNRDLNRLLAHATLHALAWCFCGLFSAVFLLRIGLSVPVMFLVLAAILVLRLALRPLVLMVAPALGLRLTVMLGTLLFAFQFPMLGFVHGVGWTLGLFCLVSAVGQVFYWTTYHAYFAAVGDAALRGSQVGDREALGALAGIVGPAAGGIMLAEFGPWPAFLAAFAIEIAAIVPLWRVSEPPIAREVPGSLYGGGKAGIWLFFSDGWIVSSSATAWSIVMFRAAGARFDTFGGLLAAAALAGALSGMLLGRFIDRGHALRLTWVNAAILAGSLILKAICGEQPIPVIAVAICTTMMSGLYIPTLMTAVYNEAKASDCPLRFQFAAEGGWDAGGTLACLVSAVICAANLPLQVVILIAVPMVAWQMRLLATSYGKNARVCDLPGADILSSPQCAGGIEHP